jgi:hypothetical protein
MKKYIYRLFIGAMLSVFVWLNFYWWISQWNSAKTIAENKAVFLNRFPLFLRDGMLIELLNILLTGISIYLFWKARSAKPIRLLSTILIGIDAFFLLCSLFSLS